MVAIELLDDQVTEHFSLRESRCKSGGEVLVTPAVIQFYLMQEEFRIWYNRIMISSSWYRTIPHNTAVGGSPISQHLYAVASDYQLPLITMSTQRKEQFLTNVRTKWYELCDKYEVYGGVGFYDWGFHIDSGQEHRTFRAFWDYRGAYKLHYSVSLKNGKMILESER